MPHGTWTTTGGGVLSVGGVAAIATAVIAVSERHTIGQAIGEAIVIAGVAMAVTVVMIPVGLVFLVRHNRRQAAMFAARCEERRAVEAAAEEARALRRAQRRAAIAAASAPVIHNHVWPSAEAAQAVMSRGYTPATIIHDRELNR